jgi:hypothetical protein
VSNGIPLGCPLPLTVTTINSIQTLKAPSPSLTLNMEARDHSCFADVSNFSLLGEWVEKRACCYCSTRLHLRSHLSGGYARTRELNRTSRAATLELERAVAFGCWILLIFPFLSHYDVNPNTGRNFRGFDIANHFNEWAGTVIVLHRGFHHCVYGFCRHFQKRAGMVIKTFDRNSGVRRESDPTPAQCEARSDPTPLGAKRDQIPRQLGVK